MENENYKIVKMHIGKFDRNENVFSLNLKKYPERLCVLDKTRNVAVDVNDPTYAVLSDTFTLKNSRSKGTVSSIGTSTNIKSETLKFTADTLNNNAALKIDLVWGEF